MRKYKKNKKQFILEKKQKNKEKIQDKIDL